MSRPALLLSVLLATPIVCTAAGPDFGDLINFRGDANNDQSINTTDIVYISNYLYSGGDEPPCMNQADVNDDGAVNNSDPVYLGNWLFSGGPPPPAPGPYNPYCDPDTTLPNPGCLNPSCLP